ncbi:MAG TPA: hypothetical protein HPQ00_02020 [Magnetococcales bacterium]|nr:hypothetical protein [Magnetococcales bacterium]
MARSEDEKRLTRILRDSERFFNYEIHIDRESLVALQDEAEDFVMSHGNIARLILARLACLAKDEESMRRHHYAILENSPDDPAIFRDYSESLRKMGYYSEAREMARRAHELAPADGELLRMLVKDCMVSGFFQASWHYLDLAIRANARVTAREYDFLSQSVLFLREKNIADPELERLQQIAIAVLRLEELLPMGVFRSPAVHMEFLYNQPVASGGKESKKQVFLMWGIQTSVRGDHLGILNARLYQAISRSQLGQHILSHIKIRFFHRTREGMMSSGFNY